MNILVEQALTYDDCISKIHTKYGPNIQVLRQKTVRFGGLLGFWEKEGIEINFIITGEQQRMQTAQSTRPGSFEDERSRILRNAARTSPELAAKIAPHIEYAAARREQKAAENKSESRDACDDRTDIENILKMVRKLDEKIDRKSEPSSEQSTDHPTVQKIETLLEQNDFSLGFIKTIVSKIRNTFSLDELADYDRVQENVVEWIGDSIQIHDDPGTARPRIIVLVGPTGVGKTTTVAKLAAAYSLAASKGSRPLNVRVITIDNYRIGAKQQIEIYGNIMNIPVSCAETAHDLEALIAMYQDVDIILIDTIGKSPKDYARIAEMRHFLDAAGTISDVHLAMSATTKATDMREIMQQYETFGYSSVIITKFDETARIGNIISVLGEKQKPIAYITTGQRVPQDFEKASVVRFLINLDGFRINRSKIEGLFPVSDTRFEWR